jgi:hypothetical protein
MKKTAIAFLVAAGMLCGTGCHTIDDWTTDPALEHVYYIGFYKTGTYSDALNYEIASGGVARWRINAGAWNVTGTDGASSPIPFQFHSERVRSYDAVTYFWVYNNAGSELTPGTDYAVTDEDGNTLSPSDGKYSLTWPQAKKGIRNIRIKRLTSASGALRVNTFDPAKGTPSTSEDTYVESTRNNLTDEYEVRSLTHDNNKVTVTFN